MKRVLLALAILLVAQPGRAEWERILSDEAGDWYFDFSTLEVKGNRREVMGLRTLHRPLHREVRSVRSLLRYDCRHKRHRMLSASLHKGPLGSGEPSFPGSSFPGGFSPPSIWVYPVPGSQQETLLSVACSR